MPKASRVKDIELCVIFFAFGAMATYFWKNVEITTALVILESAAALAIWRGRKYITVYVISAIFGPLAESVSIIFGAWSYGNPTAFGVPLWLPFLWGMAGLLAAKASEEIKFKK